MEYRSSAEPSSASCKVCFICSASKASASAGTFFLKSALRGRSLSRLARSFSNSRFAISVSILSYFWFCHFRDRGGIIIHGSLTRLHAIQVCVQPACADQFVMCTYLFDLPIFDDNYLICLPNQIELMGDNDGGLALHQFA